MSGDDAQATPLNKPSIYGLPVGDGKNTAAMNASRDQPQWQLDARQNARWKSRLLELEFCLVKAELVG